jgi:mono/diheme cytochrome c family protein
VYAGIAFVPSWQALADTMYGAWLSGKLILVVPLLLLGAVNLLVLHPRFRRAMSSTLRQEDATSRRWFRWTVVGELVLAVAVLGATAALTGVAPASSLNLEARPFEETRRTQAGNSVTLSVRPNQAGDNRVQVIAENAQRQPLTDVERTQLVLTMLDMEMGQREVQAQPTDVPGEFELRGNALSMPGRWRADVTLRRGGADEAAEFGFVVGEPAGVNQPSFSPGRILYLALVEPGREGGVAVSPRAILALVALACGAFLVVRLSGLRRRADRRPLQLAAAAFLVLGLGLGGVRVAEAYRLSLPNPQPATSQSLARGQEIYETAGCASCHGLSGRGDGPDGRLLRPRPADFRVHLAAGHTDRELFDWISNGVSGTAMPPFRDTLSEDDRWHVINYIRTFAAPTGEN